MTRLRELTFAVGMTRSGGILANSERRKAKSEQRTANGGPMPIQYNDSDQESAANRLAASPNI
jgi:hypothetical protein